MLLVCGGVSTANASSFLWISAPNWSYSAAAAASPAGTAYFWGLSAGVGSYSFAYAFSNDGLGDAAYAFAEAAAGRGGLGAVNVAGLADPWAGVGIDIGLVDPSLPGDFPTTQPGSDPFSQSYSVNDSGITFNSENSSELHGLDGLEAFVYTGSAASLSQLEAALGVNNSTGTTSTGDFSGISSLATQLGDTLIPLDSLIADPGSLSSLNFTENVSEIRNGEVILVGEGQVTTPEPASAFLLACCLPALFVLRRRLRA
jgi:hypothetical protein